MTNTIKTSECDWMRNDYCSEVVIGGIKFPTVEHAYQASKTNNRNIKESISFCSNVREARNLGRSIDLDTDDWEMKRWDVMETIILKKFLSNDILKDRLIKTNDADIVADYSDKYWGIGSDNCGDNTLGMILERVRSQLQIMEGYTFISTNVLEDEPTLKEALENSDSELNSAVQDLFNYSKILVERVSDLVSIFELSDLNDDGTLLDCIDANSDCKKTIKKIENLLKEEEEEEEEEEEDCW